MKILSSDTICALATGSLTSAIAIVRISGKEAIKITNSIFSKNITNKKSHTTHFGTIQKDKFIIDEVLITIFEDNRSFTGEETVEISCHGSKFIKEKILELLINKGCRMATAGEFTLRAFKNRKIDLSQAESIAELIAAENKSAHQVAIQQLRGGFANKLQQLRNKLIDFGSLIELELDFSEEDVEFANRNELTKLLLQIELELNKLISSFKLGNVIKNGIPVSIIGAPNVGKSTLMNRLLNEEKAIVSDIAGTTRDTIEDVLNIEGFKFRFIDTAGIRNTENKIEILGIKKSLEKAKISNIIIFIIDLGIDIRKQEMELNKIRKITSAEIITVVNKIDIKNNPKNKINNSIEISAKKDIGINKLKERLIKYIDNNNNSDNETIITNARHYEELKLTLKEIIKIKEGLTNNISNEFLAINIRQALYHLGCITGEITTDDLLGNIFKNFCIGK